MSTERETDQTCPALRPAYTAPIYKTGRDTWQYNQPCDWAENRAVSRWLLGPCPRCGSITKTYGGGYSCCNEACENSASRFVTSTADPTPKWWGSDVQVFLDGTAWCAVDGVTFTNLQESPAGFGDTPSQAVAEFVKAWHGEPAPAPSMPEPNPEPIRTIYAALPADVQRKMSLHDLKRICDAVLPTAQPAPAAGEPSAQQELLSQFARLCDQIIGQENTMALFATVQERVAALLQDSADLAAARAEVEKWQIEAIKAAGGRNLSEVKAAALRGALQRIKNEVNGYHEARDCLHAIEDIADAALTGSAGAGWREIDTHVYGGDLASKEGEPCLWIAVPREVIRTVPLGSKARLLLPPPPAAEGGGL